MHDLNLAARFGDLILAMENGKTAVFGSVEEILQADILSTIYGLPIDVLRSPEKKHTLITPSWSAVNHTHRKGSSSLR